MRKLQRQPKCILVVWIRVPAYRKHLLQPLAQMMLNLADY